MTNTVKTDMQRASQLLKLLGDQTRLTMMKLLQSHDCCVCEFVEIFKMSQPAISQHLRKLKGYRVSERNTEREMGFLFDQSRSCRLSICTSYP